MPNWTKFSNTIQKAGDRLVECGRVPIDRTAPVITTGDDMSNEGDQTDQQEVRARSSRRFRWTVPPADESVLRWVELQDNVSVSLRLLVREFIAREGYVDPMNRPVEQQPRRGRPPAGSDPNTPPTADQLTTRRATAPVDHLERDTGASHMTELAPGHHGGGQVSIDEIMASTRR